jgi:outer membrane lipoprotein-sorting protein
MFIHRRPVIAIPFVFLLATLLLAACGSTGTQQAQKQAATPTPTPNQGQQLLDKAAHNLNTAKTLHGIFDLAISGQVYNGTIKTEVWNASPDKNRTVVLQSTVTRFPTGSITVSNGKQLWQYDPTKKVVYTGPVTSGSNTGTPTATSSATGSNSDGDQVLSILNLVQSVFTGSNATLVTSSANVNGIETYEVHVTPQSAAPKAGAASFNYDGDVYLNKATLLPLRVNLTIQSVGQVQLDLPTLTLNETLANNLFRFVPPAGVKVLPLQKESNSSDTGMITLAQAEQQAGYHLLSIPISQTAYSLQGVDTLGAPGNQIYALNYTMGSTTFTISEGKSLANLPVSGQQVSLRGTTATLSSSSGSNTLTWTENGTGIQISGKLSNNQIEAIAKLLS